VIELFADAVLIALGLFTVGLGVCVCCFLVAGGYVVVKETLNPPGGKR